MPCAVKNFQMLKNVKARQTPISSKLGFSARYNGWPRRASHRAVGSIRQAASACVRSRFRANYKANYRTVSEIGQSTEPCTSKPDKRRDFCYLGFCSMAVCPCMTSDLSQPAPGLYSFNGLATTSVFAPRSFSYTTPSSATINVITPEDLYSAG